jgi:hypothetical protein
MAERLSITIPDDLYKKTESYRKKINISNICARALEKELDEIKDYVIEVKQRFYILTPAEACEIAYEAGKKWAAEMAEIEELAFVCEFNESFFSSEAIPDFVRDAVFDLLSENEKFNKLYEEYDGCVYEYFSTNASFIAEDVIAGFMGEDREEMYGDDAYQYEMDTDDCFIDGARLIWNEIKEKALVKMLGKETSEELKEKLKTGILKKVTKKNNKKKSD